MTPEQLNEIRERWAKATPEPWRVTSEPAGGVACWYVGDDGGDGPSVYVVPADEGVADVVDDAAAIAAAPSDVAALLGEVERLRREMDAGAVHTDFILAHRDEMQRTNARRLAKIRALRTENDEARMILEEVRRVMVGAEAAIGRLERERDEALAEVERLNDEASEAQDRVVMAERARDVLVRELTEARAAGRSAALTEREACAALLDEHADRCDEAFAPIEAGDYRDAAAAIRRRPAP